MNTLLRFVFRILELAFLLFGWLFYAATTLDRSEQARAYTGGNPLPGRYSILVLAIILVFYFRKTLFVKKWTVLLALLRLAVVAIALFGLLIYFRL